MIELVNLYKRFNRTILDNINITLNKGNIYVIKGVSGSGKTTLLNIIAGLDNIYQGNVYYNKENLKSNSFSIENYRQKIGYMTQKSLLFKDITVLENLKFIEDDIGKIINLSKTFGIFKLLNKYPEELSGGERQRISLIRSLLNNYEIIIADEPTSSLDYKNSINFVKFLKKIDITNKIIIIATHKDIYDEIANCIINIEYGNIICKKNKLNLARASKKNIDIIKKERNLKNDFKLIIKKRKKNNFLVNLFLIFLFLMLFFTLTLKMNFKREYVEYQATKLNYDILDLSYFDIKYLDDLIQYKYDEYRIVEKDFSAYILLHKEDSNFNLKNMIAYGNFPQQENEIIINKEFADLKFTSSNYLDIIGEKITIRGKELIISGIVELTENNYIELYGSNYYYRFINAGSRKSPHPSIFIPYNLIKKIGDKVPEYESENVLVKIKQDYLYELYNGLIFNEKDIPYYSVYATWENRIQSVVKDANFIANVGLLIFLTFGVLALIFIGNELSLRLYYRKKEIGYLQIFNISKLEISIIIIGEYMFGILKVLFATLILYILISIITKIIFGINLLISVPLLIMVILILSLYCILVVYIPLKKYLKKDIVTLIS